MVCNLFFVAAALLQWKDYIGNQHMVSTVVIIGYFLAVFLFSPLVNILYAIRLRRAGLFAMVPRWLVVSNFLFLLVQIFFIVFFLNGFFHY